MKIKQKIDPDTFLTQFNHFYDAVVRRIEFRFMPAEAFARACITLSVHTPLLKKSQGGWVNLRLTVSDVEEFAVRESAQESSRVLSSGLHIGTFNALLFFDFAPYSVRPKNLEDYRRSGFFVAGRSFSWKLEEYSERNQSKRKGPAEIT